MKNSTHRWILIANCLLLLIFLTSCSLFSSLVNDDENGVGANAPATDVANTTPDETGELEVTEVGDGEPLIEDEDPEAQTTLPATLADGELPFSDFSDEKINKLLKTDPAALGSMSIGFTNRGALMNSVQMPTGSDWTIVNARETWGTQETIEYLITMIEKVKALHPDAPPLYIGDISDPNGGQLNSHISHQAGRDADIGFYYNGGIGKWYAPGSSGTLDLARNWTMVRAMLVHTDVELILLNSSIQRLLYDYALSIGEDRNWLDSVFQYPNGGSGNIIRHSRGHHTHYHVRFFNPHAQEMGRRAYPYLLKMKKIKPPTYYVRHKVKSGQTLGHLAHSYGTSINAIKRANGLKSNLIRAGRTYRIPRSGGVKMVPAPIGAPSRHLPPTTPAMLAGVNWTPELRLVRSTPQAASVANLETAGSFKKSGTETGLTMASNTETGNVLPIKTTSAMQSNNEESEASQHYIVKTGDNLWTISKKYGVNIDEIRKINNLKSDKIRIGQKLTITSTAQITKTATSKPAVYQVKTGDSLWTIARRHDLQVAQIKKVNNLKSDKLFIGQKLVLGSNTTKPTESTAKVTYRVNSGDNLWTIARRHDLDVGDIRKWNNLGSDNLTIGQKLVLLLNP